MKKTYKFELPQNKEVEISNTRVEDGKLFVEVEFKERFEPKDGDFLVGNTGIFICKIGEKDNQIYAYAGVDNGKVCVNVEGIIWNLRSNCRYATTEEKAAFLERLEKGFHKKWNPEKKCLEDIYIPKFGDIVRIDYPDNNEHKRQYVISIFPDKEVPNTSVNYFFDICKIDMDGNLFFEGEACYNYGYVSPASESEKQELFKKLEKLGIRWNSETKKFEDIRWRAGQLCEYYSIDFNYTIKRYVESFSIEDFKRYTNGNYFRTPEAAQKVADQIKDIFKKSKVE